jgi:hypothetical protein
MVSQETLRLIMKNFERQLLGSHWNTKYVPFVATMEHNNLDGWHFHVLIYSCDFTIQELEAALSKTVMNMRLTPETFKIKPIVDNPYDYYEYCTKDIKADIFGGWESERYITSEQLFYNSSKQPKPRQARPPARHCIHRLFEIVYKRLIHYAKDIVNVIYRHMFPKRL